MGYVTASWEKDGKYLPSKGSWDRTAGELIEQLNHCGGDIGAVLGDYNPQVGAWIRFNPMDGKGCKMCIRDRRPGPGQTRQSQRPGP